MTALACNVVNLGATPQNPTETVAAPPPTVSPPTSTTMPEATVTLTPTPSIPLISAVDKDVNCRTGPGTVYMPIGALTVGHAPVPILGKIRDGQWFEIDNPSKAGTKCWVSGNVTQIIGPLELVPLILNLEVPRVTSIGITAPSNNSAICDGTRYGTMFEGTISVDGPLTVTWNINVWDRNTNTQLTFSPDETLVFNSFGTKTVDTDTWRHVCGHFYAELTITSPDNLSVQENFNIGP